MTALAKSDLKMMTGSGGHDDYLAVARKGNMVFGIKPLAAVPGKVKDIPGTTYFLARIRVAPAGSLFDQEDAESNVVQFQQKFHHPKEAWPNVTWEKSHEARVSSIYSVLVKGTLGDGAELEKMLLDAIADKKIGKKFSEQLTALLGKENMVITGRQLTDYVDKQFTDVIHGAVKAMEEKKAIQQAIFDNMDDTFGVESDVLKKLYAKIKPEQAIEDAEEEVEEEDGEDHEDPDSI